MGSGCIDELVSGLGSSLEQRGWPEGTGDAGGSW
jgi:hypothetical protein